MSHLAAHFLRRPVYRDPCRFGRAHGRLPAREATHGWAFRGTRSISWTYCLAVVTTPPADRPLDLRTTNTWPATPKKGCNLNYQIVAILERVECIINNE